MAYFIIKNEKKDGPFEVAELKEMKLPNTTLVWTEGFKNWRQAKEIGELNEITFAPANTKKITAQEIIIIVCVHLFSGLGFYCMDKTVKRKIIYPFFFIYAWFSFANVFLRVFEPLRQFHNHSVFGACTIFAGWGIVYIIGFIDVFRHLYKIRTSK